MRSGVSLENISTDVKHLIIVLNARTEEKRAIALQWLNKLAIIQSIQGIGVILHSDEDCQMTWILPYLKEGGGFIDFIYTVYDSPYVDNKNVFQWPLGVATYRHFPEKCTSSDEIQIDRPYSCNFVATVYNNSSRTFVRDLLNNNHKGECVVKTRTTWQPQETQGSLFDYIQALKLSDITISPAGLNAECYRIYEALECGSVPLVEDSTVSSGCDSKTGPLRLLKKYKAPILRVKNWTEIDYLLEKEKRMTLREKGVRREKLINWYSSFKQTLKKSFVKVVITKFFN